MIPSPIKNKLKPASAPTEKRNILGIAKIAKYIITLEDIRG
jgi:hypothetical protein